MFLGSAAFIGVDVGIITAQDRVEGPGQGLQAENVGAGPVEGKEDGNIGPKVLLELLYRGAGISIVPIGHYVTLVDAGNGLDNLRMDTGVIIAGKASKRLGGNRWHTA